MSPRRARDVSSWLIVVMTVTGCAGVEGSRRHDTGARPIARAYADGVRDGAAGLAAAREAEWGDAWVAPLVQEVWMPARVIEGVLIPAHREWVVVHPVGWRRAPTSGAGAKSAELQSGERGRP